MGALDGKHITIRPPVGSGSYYFNYKHSFSVVLLALVDSDYKFIYVDIGCNGRVSDGGVFRNSSLYAAMQTNALDFPSPEVLDEPDKLLPYVIVADDAFPLSENLMKPYASRNQTKEQRIFNYRLSRACRTVENAFGILANRFRVFLSPIALEPAKVEKVVLASCVLHNYLRERSASRAIFTPPGYMDVEDETTHYGN